MKGKVQKAITSFASINCVRLIEQKRARVEAKTSSVGVEGECAAERQTATAEAESKSEGTRARVSGEKPTTAKGDKTLQVETVILTI